MVDKHINQPIHETIREAAISRAKRKEIIREALDKHRAQELVDDLYAASDPSFTLYYRLNVILVATITTGHTSKYTSTTGDISAPLHHQSAPRAASLPSLDKTC
jgi:hypothetical protein